MELRTTEEKINELLAAYEGIRGSSVLQPEDQARLLSTPPELVAVAKAKTGSSTSASTSTATTITDQDGLVRSLRRTEAALVELRSRVEKFRKRLFEIDPVTEKPRYGPKSQGRVRLLVARNDFLCSQYSINFPEQDQHQRQQLDQYRLQQLELQEQRQEQRRQEYSKQQLELQKQQEQEQAQAQVQEQENGEQQPTSIEETMPSVAIAANMNSDGSIIINVGENNNDVKLAPNNSTESSPASLLFAELQQQYELKQQAQQRQEVSSEQARLKEEEESRRKHAEEEARRKALEAQQAAAQAAQEAARMQRLHQQAEEARLRRRAQDEARKEAERAWLNDIQKGVDGVKHYLDVLLQGSSSSSADPIDPDRIVALQSLCMLFEQIQKHPEEVNKRKIKLSNPNFHRDVGRHEGGIKLLVAAGFRPTMLPAPVATTEAHTNEGDGEVETNDNNNDNEQEEQPDIAFLISKEPNLEHDMDGWMTWFDLNKATLEILQTELNKVEGSKRSRR